MLSSFNILSNFYQNLNNKSNELESQCLIQKKRIEFLEVQVDYLNTSLRKFEAFKDKVEKEYELKLRNMRSLSASLRKMVESINALPQTILNLGLIHPPNLEKILGDIVDFKDSYGKEPLLVGVEEKLYKVKDHIYHLEERIESQLSEIDHMKTVVVQAKVESNRRGSISKKEILGSVGSPTRKSIASIGKESRVDSRKEARREGSQKASSQGKSEVMDSPAKSSKGKYFTFENGQNLKPTNSTGARSSFHKAETFKQKKNEDNLVNMAVINEDKSKSVTQRSLTPLNLENSFGSGEEIQAKAEDEKHETRQSVMNALQPMVSQAEVLRAEGQELEKAIEKVCMYVRNFEVFLSEDGN